MSVWNEDRSLVFGLGATLWLLLNTDEGSPWISILADPLFHVGRCQVGSPWTQTNPVACKLQAFCLCTVAKLQHAFGNCNPGNGDGWVCHLLSCVSGEFTFAIPVSYHQISRTGATKGSVSSFDEDTSSGNAVAAASNTDSKSLETWPSHPH